MSRIIVKNLPIKANEATIRNHFGQKGDVTDVKLMRKPNGQSRRFAFVGFKSDPQAEGAAQYFNGTFMTTSRIVVEVAKALGDESLVSRREIQQRKREREHEQDRSETTKKPRQEKDARLQEFLEVMRPQKDTAMWKNDNGASTVRAPGDLQEGSEPVRPTPTVNEIGGESQNHGAGAESDDDIVDMTKRGIEREDEDEEPWVPQVQSNSEDEAESGEKPQEDTAMSDLDWLRNRQTRIKENGEKPVQEVQEPEEEEHDGPQQVEETPEDIIARTGRLFLRNLSYTASEQDLAELFSEFGPLKEVHVPVDPKTDRSKGMAYIFFDSPQDAVEAWRKLDGHSYQGRLLHIIGGQPKRSVQLDEFDLKNLPLKKQQLLKRKAQAAKAQFSWNSLFLNRDAVLETVSRKLGVTKSQMLDPHSSNMAVQQALAESSVLESVQNYFKSKGVDLARFETKETSDKILLVKNLPFGTSLDEIRDMFSQHGQLVRVLMPPDGGLAIVQFATAPAGRAAFAKMAFRRIGNSILYLQKAPKGILDESFDGEPTQEPSGSEEPTKAKSASDLLLPTADDDETAPPDVRASVFIKNLNFSTSVQTLSRVFQALPGFITCSIKTKPDPKQPGHQLSMGFGFAEFRTIEQAQTVVDALQNHEVDGHSLQLKISTRGTSQAPAKKSAATPKIIIKNVPFETTKRDIVDLFGTFGKLRSVRVPKKFNRQTRGFAFAEFATTKEAEHAMSSLFGAHLLGRRLVMEYARADAEDPEAEIARAEAKVAGQLSAEELAGSRITGQLKSFDVEPNEEAD